MAFVSKVENLLKRYGFEHFGWTQLERPLSIEIYRQWLEKGHHASMEYLARHADLKEKPQEHPPFQFAKTAIVIAKPYFDSNAALPHPYPCQLGIKNLRTALYAKGEDYHLAFKRELEQIASALKSDFPAHEFLCCIDTAPILERDLAYRAGLGWIGKNACLIHPRHGSLFFLGQILTSLDFADGTSSAIADACGKCRRCLDACPTGALEQPRWLNSNKCISYWTIEAKQPAPESLRPQFGDWFFGCDICQTVCPWNEKANGRGRMQDLARDQAGERADMVEELRWILRASHKQLVRALSGTPVLRARPVGIKRNALIVIGNRQISELRSDVEPLLHSDALGEVAAWAYARLP